jgi:hypothetical protein
LQQFAKLSGFSPGKITASAAALGLKLRGAHRSSTRRKKSGRSHKLAISEEQQEELLTYMLARPKVWKTTGERTAGGVWGVGKKPSACRTCGRNEKPHYARGLCQSCYQKELKSTRGRKEPSSLP